MSSYLVFYNGFHIKHWRKKNEQSQNIVTIKADKEEMEGKNYQTNYNNKVFMTTQKLLCRFLHLTN